LATLREIKRRVQSVKNIEKITKAMKMVAAVKFRKAQENVLAARPYARKISEIIKNLIPTVENINNVLCEQREIKKLCVIVVTADRGMAGAFNTNLIKEAQRIIKEKYADYFSSNNLYVITVGKKAFDFFSKRNFELFAKYTGVFDKLEFISAQNIVHDVIEGYKEKKFDKVLIIYNEFKSVVQSKIIEEQFLPIVSLDDIENKESRLTNYIYEPASKELIDYLLPKHLNTQIWRVLLESFASEQAARMTAMESATSNANELIESLQLIYNKARQASITKELLEVVSGAEALREST
jgi:F-type H+-transporting ATPase subunit gamma